jgi:hypothetical protein
MVSETIVPAEAVDLPLTGGISTSKWGMRRSDDGNVSRAVASVVIRRAERLSPDATRDRSRQCHSMT